MVRKTDFAGKVIWWNGTNLKMQNIEDHDPYEFEHEVGTIIEYDPPQLIKGIMPNQGGEGYSNIFNKMSVGGRHQL